MKLCILTLFSLAIAISSGVDTSMTNNVKDQKSDNSVQNYLTPLNHDTHRIYNLKGVDNDYEDLLRHYYRGYVDENVDYLKNQDKYYDYYDTEEDYLRNQGRRMDSNGRIENKPNILWRHSKNVGGLKGLVSRLVNDEPNDWDIWRKSGAKLGRHSRIEDGLKNRNFYNMRQGYENLPQNYNSPSEHEHRGYIHHQDLHRKHISDSCYCRLIGRKGLGFDKRLNTSHGMRAPITPSLLNVSRRKHHNGFNQHKNYNNYRN